MVEEWVFFLEIYDIELDCELGGRVLHSEEKPLSEAVCIDVIL